MKKSVKVELITCAVLAAVGVLISYVFLQLNNYSLAETKAEQYRLLADCFTMPGVLFLMLGSLIWVSGLGALDGITFLLHRLWTSLIPGARLNGDETYYDYVQRKREKKPKAHRPLLMVGAAFTVLGIIFIIMFYQVF